MYTAVLNCDLSLCPFPKQEREILKEGSASLFDTLFRALCTSGVHPEIGITLVPLAPLSRHEVSHHRNEPAEGETERDFRWEE